MKRYRCRGRAAVASVAAVTWVLLGFISTADAGEDAGLHGSGALVPPRFELEPHLLLGTAPPGFGQGSGIGGGIRGNVVILRNGFIPNVSDSVAIGFGFDYGYYKGEWARGWRDKCLQFEVAPDGGQVCSESTTAGGTYQYIFIPFVVQWNLWLSHRLSAFVEPGVQLYHLTDHGFGAVPAASLGGRVRLSNRIALTAHLGYPTSALGLAILL